MQERLFISDEMLRSENLPYEVGDLVAAIYMTRTSKESAATLRGLPPQWGTLEPLMYYDAEVRNGGHHQYFWNSQGYFADLVEKGLEDFCAGDYLQIFREALARYDPTRYEMERREAERNAKEKREADWKEVFLRGYHPDRYEGLDGQYYKSDPPLVKVVENRIRANIEEFR